MTHGQNWAFCAGLGLLFSGLFRLCAKFTFSCLSDSPCSCDLRSIDDGSFHLTIHTDHLDDIGVRDPREIEQHFACPALDLQWLPFSLLLLELCHR